MAAAAAGDDKFSLHVDSDWKKQAQEEKKRLAEQEAARRKAEQQQAATPAGVISTAASPSRSVGGGGAAAGAAGAGAGQASFAGLVQSLMTQVLYYLGELAIRGERPVLAPDAAKLNLDLLAILDEKTRGNLTPEERQILDVTLYECQMRYVALASRLAELP